MRRLAGKSSLTEVHRLQYPSVTVDSAEIALTLGSHYFPAYPPFQNDSTTLVRDEYTEWRKELPPLLEGQSISYAEVYEQIGHRKRKTAPGPDNIPYLVLTRCADIITPYLQAFYSGIILCGHYPRAWKQAQILNVLKPSKKGDHASDFRPIALLNCFSKILETILSKRLSRLSESCNVLPSEQYGFRSGRTTSQPLWQLTDDIFHAYNNRSRLLAISLDFAGAYDRVCPFRLWKKMKSSGAFPEALLRVLGCFLIQRTTCISVQGDGHLIQPSRGLVQGSPLSPILYAIYASDLTCSLPGLIRPLLYADDLLLYCFLDDMYADVAKDSMQQALNQITHWATENVMKINPDKTQMMVFQRNRNTTVPVLRLHNRSLTQSPQLRYLGIVFDKGCRFSDHIQEKTCMALQRLSIIRRLGASLWGTQPSILR